MTAGNGKPCNKCSTSEWDPKGNCKQCARDRARKWQKDNQERSNQNKARWRRKNHLKTRNYARNYREENRTELRNYARNYREENRAELRNYARNYRRKNKEKRRRYFYQYRQQKSNKQKRAAYEHARRARLYNASGNYTVEEWVALCEQCDNRCLACESKGVKLTVDHVLPLSKGGNNSISNIQPLCLNCNLKKGTKCIDYRASPRAER